MRILKISFDGNPNVGLYGYATDSYVLIGKEVPEKHIKSLKTVFKIPLHSVNVAGTGLLGVFISGNKNGIILPSICFENELEEFDKLKLKYSILKTRLTCLGNNILANDKGALVNPNFSDSEIDSIKKALKVPVSRMMIADIETPGSAVILNGNTGIIHRDVEPNVKTNIEEFMGVKLEECTVNMGNPYVSSGILCNKYGMIIGGLSGGPEIVYASQALGFNKKKKGD